MEEDPNVMRKGFNPEMTAQPYDWKKKEIIDLEALSKPVLDFTKWWIERKLEKLVVPASGFTYRLLGHRSLRDERSRQISKGTIEERENPFEDVGTKKGKEVPREKHPRSEKIIREPQNKKQKYGDAPPSPSRTPSVQEIETFERQDAGTSIRRFEQEENLDRPMHDRLSINAYEKSMQERGRGQDIAIEESLATILEQEMINDEDSALEEENP